MTENKENTEKLREETGNEEEMSMEELLKSEIEFSRKLYNGEIVKVKVVQITDGKILVDINEKKEGIILLSDFENEKIRPEAGMEVEAVLDKKGNEKRYTYLSYLKAKEKISRAKCEEAFNLKERTKGRVADIVRGGYIVDICGVKAFMPLSLSEIGGAHKHYLPKNAKVKIYITDFNKNNGKIIVSRRLVLEEDEKERKKKIFAQIKTGNVVRVVVSKVLKDGLFARFQGIEGFIRLEDMAWKNPEESFKKYKRGQRIKCRILLIDNEKERISFGIKQLTPDPVSVLKRKFPYRSVLKVKIESVDENGAKVKISDRVKGFIPASDFGYDGKPAQFAQVKAIVFGVNPETYEINMSIKKFENYEEKKKIQGYLKNSPSLTLGQILGNGDSDE